MDTPGTLHGKKIILLGGSSGLGLATAKAAATEGAAVTIVSANQARIDAALRELNERPAAPALPTTSGASAVSISPARGFAVDLGKEENIRDFFAGAGPFDHLVYTAGENISLAMLKDITVEQARRYFNLRYWGAFTAVKYAAPLINAGGSINLTGGIASPRPGAGWSLGASICAAMEGFTRAMAVELAPIRVNLVSPGVVRTNLWNGMPEADREELYRSVGDSLPVKRVGEAEDIAQAFVYLMKQRFSTGQVHVVDGGTVLV